MKDVFNKIKNNILLISISIALVIIAVIIIVMQNELPNNMENIVEMWNTIEPTNTDNDMDTIKDYTQNSNQSEQILYEKKINEQTAIRVRYLGSVLAQRSIIGIEKTVDGGKTWENQLEDYDGYMQIHNGAKFVFIDENIGFINDPGLAGTGGENRGLLVTVNGGKNFVNANIIHPEIITEDNLFVDEVPYLENGQLKVQIYTINHNKSPEKTYYKFYTNDNGLNWKYEE